MEFESEGLAPVAAGPPPLGVVKPAAAEEELEPDPAEPAGDRTGGSSGIALAPVPAADGGLKGVLSQAGKEEILFTELEGSLPSEICMDARTKQVTKPAKTFAVKRFIFGVSKTEKRVNDTKRFRWCAIAQLSATRDLLGRGWLQRESQRSGGLDGS